MDEGIPSRSKRLGLSRRPKTKCSNFILLAKAGIPAGSGETPLEEMDFCLREKGNDILVMYKEFKVRHEGCSNGVLIPFKVYFARHEHLEPIFLLSVS